MPTNTIDAIYTRHMAAIQHVSDTHHELHGSVVGFSLHLALQECAAQFDADHDHALARIERLLEHYDSALYADVVNDRTDLPTAIDALLNINRVIIATLTADLTHANRLCTELEQQLAAMDADNTHLMQELRTLRSYAIATPDGNGKTAIAGIVDDFGTVQTPPPPLAPQASLHIHNAATRSTLSQAASDYAEGLTAGRWQWRQLPKPIRLELVRYIIRQGERFTQSEFDHNKPDWMPTANAHVQTFDVPWSVLSDLTREIEVQP